MAQLNEQFRRMQQLAGIVVEAQDYKKFDAKIQLHKQFKINYNIEDIKHRLMMEYELNCLLENIQTKFSH